MHTVSTLMPSVISREQAGDAQIPSLSQKPLLVTGMPTLASLASDVIVEVCRRMRAEGHVAGTADAQSCLRMALDLARLRDLPGPDRQEVLEALQSGLGQGEAVGRGRALAQALEPVMIGRARGHLAPDAPRSGLLPHVLSLLEKLRLPGPEVESRKSERMRLDPLRSPLDRARHLALQRLQACHVPYGKPEESSAAGDVESLQRVWSVHWTPGTDASLAVAGLWGVTLPQAAEGALRAQIRSEQGAMARLASDEKTAVSSEGSARAVEGLVPGLHLALLEQAAECGLAGLSNELLEGLMTSFVESAGLAELVRARLFLMRLTQGHLVGLQPALESESAENAAETPSMSSLKEAPPEAHWQLPASVEPNRLLGAAVAALEGLAGSSDPDDALALLELIRLFQAQDPATAMGSARLEELLARLSLEASPFMQGAASAGRLLLQVTSSTDFAALLGSWVDTASAYENVEAGAEKPGADDSRTLAERLFGALVVASPRLEADPTLLEALSQRVEALNDAAFLARLPGLRQGFSGLSPAARDRWLESLSERLDNMGAPTRSLDGRLDTVLSHGADWLALFAAADAEGQKRAELSPSLFPALSSALSSPKVSEQAQSSDGDSVDAAVMKNDIKTVGSQTVVEKMSVETGSSQVLSARDRWRLILGREKDRLSGQARRMARALDELYGAGKGEGSRTPGALGGPGGSGEPPFPTTREWAEELEALFGTPIREEVLGRAAAEGRVQAALELDPNTVTPSVELLETVLALKGSLPESKLGALRTLVARVVEALTIALSQRLRPALSGLSLPRPTRRAVGPLDLPRTLKANLDRVQVTESGAFRLVPERLYFKTRARKSMDWHLFLVVDVSGSMEASVIYSAIMASILNALPALTVEFLAFSTEVMDLSHRVDDPLALLLEISVGGGTHIGKALRAARTRVKVPSRSLVVVVTDFEEGGSPGDLLAEVRELVDMGTRALGLAALDDRGQPRYNRAMAERVVEAGMPVAALTPLELARWVGEQIR